MNPVNNVLQQIRRKQNNNKEAKHQSEDESLEFDRKSNIWCKTFRSSGVVSSKKSFGVGQGFENVSAKFLTKGHTKT